VAYDRVKYLPTVKRIPDEIWDEIRMILPPEKPDNTIGRPAVSFRKVLDGILYVLRTECQWKMLPNELVQVLHVIEDFSNGQYLRYLRDYGLDC
jgi:transposase